MPPYQLDNATELGLESALGQMRRQPPKPNRYLAMLGYYLRVERAKERESALGERSQFQPCRWRPPDDARCGSAGGCRCDDRLPGGQRPGRGQPATGRPSMA